MDLGEWKTGLASVGSALAAAIFTHLKYRRTRSKDSVAEAEDSTSAVYVGKVLVERDEALKQARANLDLYIAEQRRADRLESVVLQHERRIGELTQQLERVTRSLIRLRPELTDVLSQSGFGEPDLQPRTGLKS